MVTLRKVSDHGTRVTHKIYGPATVIRPTGQFKIQIFLDTPIGASVFKVTAMRHELKIMH